MGKHFVAYSLAGGLLMATLPRLAVAQRQDRAQSICAYRGQEKTTERKHVVPRGRWDKALRGSASEIPSATRHYLRAADSAKTR
jgi:hypothetical protein